MIRLERWAAQMNECRQSGLSVRQWCEENSVNMKTYYNRMAKVREAMLEDIETGSYEKAFNKSGLGMNKIPTCPGQGNSRGLPHSGAVEAPVFTALPMMQSREPVMTVRIGEWAVEIQAGLEESVLEQVLRVVSRI